VSVEVPRVALISVTVAPGITPPDVSRTEPVMDPLVICANATAGLNTTADDRKNRAMKNPVWARDVIEFSPKLDVQQNCGFTW
jgi:hypothetical protein